MSASRHKSSKPSPKRQRLILLAAITTIIVACTAVIQLILAVLALLHGLGRVLQHFQLLGSALEEPLLMGSDTRVDRLLQGFLDVAARPACRQDCSAYRYGPASRAAHVGQRAVSAAGDFGRAGRVLMRNMEELVSWGHFETARRWLDRCGGNDIESDPKLAIGAGWFAGHLGDAERARRYVRAAQRFDLDVPSPDGASTLRASMINLRSTLGLDGVSQMLDDGLSLLASEAAAGTRWLRSGYRICGAAQIMLGRTQEAIGSFEQMVWLTEDNDQRRAGRAFCLGYLGLACGELGDWARARRYCDEAAEVMSDHESTVDGLPVRVARAAILARDGDVAEVARHLAALQPLLARMRSSPLLCADLSARCAEIAHEAGQREAALALYDAARRACSQVPDAGAIPLRLGRLEGRMSPGGRPQASLTPAEMRVLRQLATHRTLQEIAQHLHVSRSTVKTQVASIHAKLGVTSRAQAVEAAGLGPIPGPDQATS